MSKRTFLVIAGLIFLLVAVIHALRLALGWQVTISSWNVPMWVSWVALVIAGFLSYKGLKHSRNP